MEREIIEPQPKNENDIKIYRLIHKDLKENRENIDDYLDYMFKKFGYSKYAEEMVRLSFLDHNDGIEY